jgi:hypothetical protein
MGDKVTIDKRVFFQLAASRSRLAQAEYNRNPAYNDGHFAEKAEGALVESNRKRKY